MGDFSTSARRAILREFALHDIRPIDYSAGQRRPPPGTTGLPTRGTDYLVKAFATELEHGTTNPGTNVTMDQLAPTVGIAAAHLLGVEWRRAPSEWIRFPAYYDELWAAEKRNEAEAARGREVDGA